MPPLTYFVAGFMLAALVIGKPVFEKISWERAVPGVLSQVDILGAAREPFPLSEILR